MPLRSRPYGSSSGPDRRDDRDPRASDPRASDPRGSGPRGADRSWGGASQSGDRSVGRGSGSWRRDDQRPSADRGSGSYDRGRPTDGWSRGEATSERPSRQDSSGWSGSSNRPSSEGPSSYGRPATGERSYRDRPSGDRSFGDRSGGAPRGRGGDWGGRERPTDNGRSDSRFGGRADSGRPDSGRSDSGSYGRSEASRYGRDAGYGSNSGDGRFESRPADTWDRDRAAAGRERAGSGRPTEDSRDNPGRNGLRADGSPRRPAPARESRFSGGARTGGAKAKRPVRRTDPVVRTKQGLGESVGWERDAPAAPQESIVAKKAASPRTKHLPDTVSIDLTKSLGGRRAGKVALALTDAAQAFERDRFSETLRILRPLVEEAPDSAPVRELFGLACYRDGKWAEAVRHLTAFTELSGSVDQHPVLADAHRALKHHSEVAALWDDLSQSSPSAQLVAEGRIVMAGSFADQGRLDEAISLMERGALDSRNPKDHHLRMWYCLADMYERAGDTPRARDRFQRIMAIDVNFANVAERIANLG
jgi:hypothetical protein